MSFKYRFIFSFVLLETFFILLIVTMNFITINNSSKQLTEQKIESNITFLKDLLAVPVSIFDLATVDNLVSNTVSLKHIDSVVVLDANENIISQSYNYKSETLDALLSKKEEVNLLEEGYNLFFEELILEDVKLGSFLIIFDNRENTEFIEKNQRNTALVIVFEILISMILSFIIGSRLTNALESLSTVAEEIGENKNPDIPFLDRKDEIGKLSNSMHQMQDDLVNRNSKLKELAVELNRQKNELLEADKYKNDFLANMSHELKTPLNSINVISSVMMKNKKGELKEDQVKNLEVINNCGKDLLYLINDVLDISKLEAGEVELNLETIEFRGMMDRVKAMFEPQVKEKNLEFICSFDDSIEYVHSDRQRIKQIIKNLLSNALKFTQEGSVTLRTVRDEEYFILEVVDEGIGIAKEKLEHIFDRFKQADGSTTRNYGGTGLGLAICKELAVLLNGDITVESEEGKGSIFRLRLPMNKQLINMDEITIEQTQEEHQQSEIERQVSKEKEIFASNEEVLVFNQDVVGFMPLIVELKKEWQIKQFDSLSELVKELGEKSYKHLIFDLKENQQKSYLKLVDHFNLKPIVIQAFDGELEKSVVQTAKAVYSKPISKDEIINRLKG